MLRDEAFAQSAIARAEALVSSARAFVFESIGDMWSTMVSGTLPSHKQRARGRLAMAHTNSACTEAVELLYKANQAAGAAAGAGAGTAAGPAADGAPSGGPAGHKPGDVIDAEYVDVDETKRPN